MNAYLKPTPERKPSLSLVIFLGFAIGILIGVVALLSTSKVFQSAMPADQPQPVLEQTGASKDTLPLKIIVPLPSPTPGVKTASQSEQENRNFITGLIGKPAPDFELKTLDGKRYHLADLKGKPVLINVWASWCPPCRDEMPAIQAAYVRYKDKGLVVLGMDFLVQDSLKDVKLFVDTLKLTFPILLDETGAVSGDRYGVRGLPTSFLIDRNGVIRRTKIGAMSPEEINRNILEILN
jgi:cytochrome c biogenesis protein CcmG, thiol:disulfide interchange protein DsbE